jgi:2'-5' RNA ligase
MQVSGVARPRLFFALWPDRPAQAALAALAADRAVAHAGRAIATPALHLTLAFLGSVAATDLPAIRAAARRAARAARPLVVQLGRLGGPGHGGIAWLEGDATTDLLALRAGLLAALADAGIAVDAATFRPHVTLARGCRRPVGAGTAAVAWPVATLALVESLRTPAGARYVTRGRYRLGPAAPRISGSPAAPRRTPASRRRG